jgi:FAD/FMN-containing dehydrogenase
MFTHDKSHAAPALEAKALAAFSQSFRGDVIGPADARYEEARKVHNGMIDKRPALIVRPADASDVVQAVRLGRDANLLIAIRGGAHNGPGFGTCDGGLVIDMGGFKDIQVDPAVGTVRAGAGCTQGEVDAATHAFGLAVPAGIVASTGIAGLTLGGGHGYLSRAHGLTIDNLLEAEVVLADGRQVTANKDENADLFWALRGGGGNFGVVTSFLYRAHPVKNVYAGLIFWDIADAKQVMQFYRGFLAQTPETLFPFLGLKSVPSGPPFPENLWGRRVCAIIACFNGPAAEGEALMRPLREALPEPIFDHMGEMPFPALQGLFDPLFPKGLQWYWKGDFVQALPDEAIDTHLAQMAKAPNDFSLVHFYPIDGAVHRVGAQATAWSFRDATWSMVIAAIDPDPAKAPAIKAWGRAYWEAVHPYNLSSGYLNFMMDDEAAGRVEANYGPNFPRLRAVKKKYDPANLFRVNQNIAP